MKPARSLMLWLLAGWACASDVRLARGEVAESQSNVIASPDAQDMLFLGPMRPLLWRLHITVDGKPFRQIWLDRFEGLFAQEDRDHDGRVTVEQAEAIEREMNGSMREVPKASSDVSALRAAAQPAGTLDRTTLLTHIEKSLPPLEVHRRAVVDRGSALALFPLLDLDRNHQLSAAELGDAEAQLFQRDFNDDRVITGAELILDPNAIAAAADPRTAERNLEASESPLLAVDAHTPPVQIAEKLLKYYDRNRDGQLTTNAPDLEIKLPRAVLSQLDTSGDGALDGTELAKFADRRPDLELSFAMGRVNARESRKRAQPSEREFRVRQTLERGYDLRLGEANILFKRNNRDPQEASDPATFRTYDRDNNSYLDESEAGTGGLGKVTFAAMDADGDGKVFKAEFSTFMDRQNAAAATRLVLEVSDSGQDLFELLDIDQDGALSPRELRSAKEILNRADKNGDGMLNGDEIPQRLMFELVRGAEARSDQAMANQGPRRPTRSTATASTSGPLWFRKMDRNNDADLSPHEFLGPREAFDKLDANRDGLVDREEAEAAGK